MNLYNTQTCCTALELGNFSINYNNLNQFKRGLIEEIHRYNSQETDFDDEFVSSLGFIIAYTNDRQGNVNMYLEKLGFNSTPFLSKDKHPETKVAMHWIPVPDLMKALGL